MRGLGGVVEIVQSPEHLIVVALMGRSSVFLILCTTNLVDTCIGAGRDRTKLLEDNVDRAHDGNGLRGVRGQTQRHLFILRSAARRAAVPSRRFLSPYAPPFHLFNFPEAHKPDGPQRLVGLFLFLFLQLLFPFTNSQLGHAQKK